MIMGEDDYGGKMGVETPIFLNGLILWGIIGLLLKMIL